MFIYEKNFKELLLDKIFPNENWICNKIVPDSFIKNRPDFRSERLKLIIEFNGDRTDTFPGHYSSTKTILTDKKKKYVYEYMGYKVVEYPYFVQPNTAIIKLLFNVDYEFVQIYPHGFIDSKAKLPWDFCDLGVDRFINDLHYFYIIKEEICL